MIYTGYYAYTRKYRDNGLTTVAISRTIPNFYEGYKLEMFAPPMDLLYRYKMKEVSEQEYEEVYREQLDNLLIQKEDLLKDTIEKLYEKDVVLLCYEKRGDFCHRHILADWLNEKCNIGVKEYINS